MASLLLDRVIRANQSGAGTATDGSTYSVVRGSTTLSIVSNEIQATAVTAETFVQGGTQTGADADAVLRLSVSSTNYTAVGIVLRATSSTTYYRARVNSNSSSVGIGITKVIAGTATTLVQAAFTASINTFYLLRFKIIGSNLYAKVWADGTVEPNWQVSIVDTSITAAGNVGVVVATTTSADIAKLDSLYFLDGSGDISQNSGAFAETTATTGPTTTTTTTSTEQNTGGSAEAMVTPSTAVATDYPSVVSGTPAIQNTGVSSVTGAKLLPGQTNYNGVSNLLFGTNLANYSSNSASLYGNTSVQQKLKAAKLQVVRAGTSHAGSGGNHGTLFTDAEIDQQLAGIAACGAIPLLILPSPFGGDTTAFNLHVVNYTKGRCSLFHYSNEPDISKHSGGYPYTQYFNDWAAQVPNWRTANPNAAFGAPVLGVFGNLNSYLGNFLKLITSDGRASIVPDFIDIHNYPASSYGSVPSQSTALASAANIGNSVQTTRNLIKSIFGYEIAVTVTEWNVDAAFKDPYRDDPTFAAQFYAAAIQGMITAGCAMSNQFEHVADYITGHQVAGGPFKWIDGNTYTGPAYYAPLQKATSSYLTGSTGGGTGGSTAASVSVSPASINFTGPVGTPTTTPSTGVPGVTMYAPAYSGPTDPNGTSSWWHQYENTSGMQSAIIANPNSGPGSAKQQTFVDGITAMHQAGVKVYGYVNTSNGSALTATATVESQIDQWYSWYPNIDGIHFDTVLPTSGNLSYYTTLYTYVKGKNSAWKVWHNPSQLPPESYLSTPATDIVGIFEDSYANLGKFKAVSTANYTGTYAPSRFAVTIVGMPIDTAKVDATFQGLVNGGVGLIFITDQSGASPYFTPPNTTIFNEVIKDCQATIPAATTTTSVTPPPSQVVQVSDVGGAAGTWTVTGAASWLTLGATSGTLQPGTSQNVSLSASQANLAAGTYTANLVFTIGSTSVTVPVTFTVTNSVQQTNNVTPLSVFLSAQASAINTNSNQLYPSTSGSAGGTPPSTAVYTYVAPGPGFGIIAPQNQSLVLFEDASLEAPSGYGFTLDSSMLTGKFFPAGGWSLILRYNTGIPNIAGSQPGGSINADLYGRAYILNSGVYTLIAQLALIGQVVNANQTEYTFSPVQANATTYFGPNDHLYVELNGNNKTSLGDTNLYLQLNRLSTDTVNFVGDTQAVLVTPGFINGNVTFVTEQNSGALAETIATTFNVGPTTFSTEQNTGASAEALATVVSNIPTTVGYSVTIAGLQVPIKEGKGRFTTQFVVVWEERLRSSCLYLTFYTTRPLTLDYARLHSTPLHSTPLHSTPSTLDTSPPRSFRL